MAGWPNLGLVQKNYVCTKGNFDESILRKNTTVQGTLVNCRFSSQILSRLFYFFSLLT